VLSLRHFGVGDTVAQCLAIGLRDMPFIETVDLTDNRLTDTALANLCNALCFAHPNGATLQAQLPDQLRTALTASAAAKSRRKAKHARAAANAEASAAAKAKASVPHQGDADTAGAGASSQNDGSSGGVAGGMSDEQAAELAAAREAAEKRAKMTSDDIVAKLRAEEEEEKYAAVVAEQRRRKKVALEARQAALKIGPNDPPPNYTIQAITLAKNAAGEATATVLGRLLGGRGCNVEMLDVSHCRITDETASIMVSRLRKNVSLTTLELGHNTISAVGVAAVAKALWGNKTLKHLRVRVEVCVLSACTRCPFVTACMYLCVCVFVCLRDSWRGTLPTPKAQQLWRMSLLRTNAC